MSIPSNNLALGTTTSILASGTGIILQAQYKVEHVSTGYIIATGSASASAPNIASIEDAFTQLCALIDNEYQTILAFHLSRPQISNLSLFDAANVLRDWTVYFYNAKWYYRHPLSGTFNFSGTPDAIPTLTGRVTSITSRFLVPPIWASAKPASATQLQYWTAPVAGAAGYSIYNDLGNGTYVKLADVAIASGTITVAAGFYNIRICARAAGGIPGILSNVTSVTIGMISPVMESFAAAPLSIAATDAASSSVLATQSLRADKSDRISRILSPVRTWFGKLFHKKQE